MLHKTGLGLLFCLAAVLALWAGSHWLDRSRPRAVSGAEVAYICLETHEVVHGPVQSVPAPNPKTGRNTLVRAVYSVRESAWVASPPEEVLRRQQRSLAGEEDGAALLFAAPEEDAQTETDEQ